MNKILKIVALVVGILIVFYSIVSLTGIFKIFKSSTNANEPNLKVNSWFFVSNLVSPKNGDFVCYKYEDKTFGKQMLVHKLCGMGNELVEIKNGVVYLNGINIDEEEEHIHFYELSLQEYEPIKSKKKLAEDNFAFRINENAIRITLEDAVAEKYAVTAKRVIDEKGKEDPFIKDAFHQNWNKDNFGPLKIPLGKVFVLGDNRDNSRDSRYIGFINESDIIGVVIRK